MTLEETLNLVLSRMEYGLENWLSKDDIKELVKAELGYRPKAGPFEEAFLKARLKYDVFYMNDRGWYRIKRNKLVETPNIAG